MNVWDQFSGIIERNDCMKDAYLDSNYEFISI